ncbi:hypothetical protein RKD38_007393 [Streptomyces ambofaciens]
MDAVDEGLVGDGVLGVDLVGPLAEFGEFGVGGAVGVEDADGDVGLGGVEGAGVVGLEGLYGELLSGEGLAYVGGLLAQGVGEVGGDGGAVLAAGADFGEESGAGCAGCGG